MKVAAVTMAYNEPDFLPIWARHYARQVGAGNRYVVDHGSDRGSVGRLDGANVLRIPRSPHDEPRRAAALSRLCSSLLQWYDCVIYSNVDEMIVADPRFYPTLADYCAASYTEVETAVGLNLLQTEDDPPIDPQRPITEQRHWVRFAGSMCKPVLIRRSVTWGAGFHRADAPIVFGGLFLFHLRWVDRDIGLRRLAKTREMPWADPDAGWWQRCSDERCLELFSQFASYPRRDHVRFDITMPPLSDTLQELLGPAGGREDQPDSFNVNLERNELWPIPSRFRRAF